MPDDEGGGQGWEGEMDVSPSLVADGEARELGERCPSPLDVLPRGRGPTDPVRDLDRQLRVGQGQRLGHRLGRIGRRAGPTHLGTQHIFGTRLGVMPLPAPHGRATDARPPGHALDAQAMGRKQNDSGPLGMLERTRAVAGGHSQSFRVGRIKEHADRSSHNQELRPSPYAWILRPLQSTRAGPTGVVTAKSTSYSGAVMQLRRSSTVQRVKASWLAAL